MASILVVDDDAVSRTYMHGVLTGAGHDVRFATSGRDAIELYEQQAFDIVIMDLAMPDMNGHLATRELCTRYPSAKVVAVSGTDAAQLEYTLEYGAREALSKPVDPATLRAVIDTLLRDEGAWDSLHLL